MDIIHDYAAIGPLVKGDTWWTAEKPAKEPEPVVEPELFGRGPAMALVDQALCEVERLFALPEDAIELGRVTFRTSLPSATWRGLSAGKPHP